MDFITKALIKPARQITATLIDNQPRKQDFITKAFIKPACQITATLIDNQSRKQYCAKFPTPVWSKARSGFPVTYLDDTRRRTSRLTSLKLPYLNLITARPSTFMVVAAKASSSDQDANGEEEWDWPVPKPTSSIAWSLLNLIKKHHAAEVLIETKNWVDKVRKKSPKNKKDDLNFPDPETHQILLQVKYSCIISRYYSCHLPVAKSFDDIRDGYDFDYQGFIDVMLDGYYPFWLIDLESYVNLHQPTYLQLYQRACAMGLASYFDEDEFARGGEILHDDKFALRGQQADITLLIAMRTDQLFKGNIDAANAVPDISSLEGLSMAGKVWGLAYDALLFGIFTAEIHDYFYFNLNIGT